MVTYAANQTWSGAGYQQSISGWICVRSFLAPPLTTSSPFVGVPVDLGDRIVQVSLQRQRVFWDRSGPLVLPENILYARYRFSSEGIRYLIVLVRPYVDNAYCCALCLRERVEEWR